MEPPEWIVELARRYAEANPSLADPEGASGWCAVAADELATIIPGGETVHLVGFRTSFPGRAEDYRDYDDPDPHLVHAACRIGDWYVDATRRQFDPSCSHPHVAHASVFEAEWMRITTGEPDHSREALDELRAELDAHLSASRPTP